MSFLLYSHASELWLQVRGGELPERTRPQRHLAGQGTPGGACLSQTAEGGAVAEGELCLGGVEIVTHTHTHTPVSYTHLTLPTTAEV